MNSGKSIDNQKVLGNCPSCHGLMQIPVSTDVSAVAKCPHCKAKIPIRELLSSIAPEAELVGDDDIDEPEVDYAADRQRVYKEDNHSKPREKFVVPKQLSEGASRRARKRHERALKKNNAATAKAKEVSDALNGVSPERRRSSVNGESDRRNSSPDQEASTKRSPAISTESRSPVKRASSSGSRTSSFSHRGASKRSSSSRRRDDDEEQEFTVVDIAKFIGGGLIAAPIAYLALLWTVGVDPFGMASTFESVSPSIVPEALRTDDSDQGLIRPVASPTGSATSTSATSAPGATSEGLPKPETNPDSVR